MEKRGNWSEFHFSEVTSYKIHTLGGQIFCSAVIRQNDRMKPNGLDSSLALIANFESTSSDDAAA